MSKLVELELWHDMHDNWLTRSSDREEAVKMADAICRNIARLNGYKPFTCKPGTLIEYW